MRLLWIIFLLCLLHNNYVVWGSLQNPTVINNVVAFKNLTDLYECDVNIVVDEIGNILFALCYVSTSLSLSIFSISPSNGSISSSPTFISPNIFPNNTNIPITISTISPYENIIIISVIYYPAKTYLMAINEKGERVDDLILNDVLVEHISTADTLGMFYSSKIDHSTVFIFQWNPMIQKIIYSNTTFLITKETNFSFIALSQDSVYINNYNKLYKFSFNISSPPILLEKPLIIKSNVTIPELMTISVSANLLVFKSVYTIAVYDTVSLELKGTGSLMAYPQLQNVDVTLSNWGSVVLLRDTLFSLADANNLYFISGFTTSYITTNMFLASTMTKNIRYCYLAYLSEYKIVIWAFDTNPTVSPVQVGLAANHEVNTIPTTPMLISDSQRGSVWSTSGPLARKTNTFKYLRNISISSSLFSPIISFYPGFSESISMRLGNHSQYMILAKLQQKEVYLIEMNSMDNTEFNYTYVFSIPPPDSLHFSHQFFWGGNIAQTYMLTIGSYDDQIRITQTFNQESQYFSEIYFNGFIPSYPFISSTTGSLIPNTEVAIAIFNSTQTAYIVLGSEDGNDTVAVELSFSNDNINLTIINNTLIMPDCSFLQSKLEGEDGSVQRAMWTLCANSKLNQFNFFRLEFPTKSVQCIIPVEANFIITGNQSFPLFSWSISTDGARLAFYFENTFKVYDISACSQQGLFRLISEFIGLQTYNALTLHPYQGSYLVVVQEAISGNIIIFSDCPSGYKSGIETYCYQCPVGTYGPTCLPCPPGFVCDQIGTVFATQLCPSGYYCLAGTSTIQFENITGSPLPCPAGSYCPPGVSVGYISSGINSPKKCSMGYYCPENSSSPNQFHCPSFTTSEEGSMSIEDCKCVSGYFGYAGYCLSCPSECNCYEDVISSCFLPSYSNMSYLVSKRISPIPCPTFGINNDGPCNPDLLSWTPGNSSSFPCKEGYSDRLCGKCTEGYFLNARKCEKCNQNFEWELPLVYLLVAILITIYGWNTTPAKSRIVQITVFHFQSLYTLLISGVQWDFSALSFFHASSSVTNFSLVAIDCLLKWWNPTYTLVFILLFPFLTGIFAVFAMLFSNFIRLITSNPLLERGYYKVKSAKLVAVVTSLSYFSIMIYVLQALGCAGNDQAGHRNYLIAYPWIECTKWNTIMTIGMLGLVLLVFGLPLFLYFKLRRISLSNTYDDPWNKEVFGSFYAVYFPKYYYWELIIIFRRFCTAILVSFFPYNHPAVIVCFFMLVLSYMILLMKFNPHLRTMDNILDNCSQFVLLAVAFTGVILPTYKSFNFSLSIFAVVINILLLLLTVGCFVDSYAKVIYTNTRNFIMCVATNFRKLLSYCKRDSTTEENEHIALIPNYK